LQRPDPTTMAAPWSAAELIQQLQLLPHPEGGHYRETHRAALQIQTPWGLRAVSTAILYLLQSEERSCWHRIRSDEAWHHHGGGGLVIYAIGPDGTPQELRLGLDLASGQRPQHVVPAGSWFAATPAPAAPGAWRAARWPRASTSPISSWPALRSCRSGRRRSPRSVPTGTTFWPEAWRT
jgi:uncharacterized protein